MRTTIAALSILPLLLGGCVSAVKTVVTAPVKAVGKVADWSTTSQEEADRNLGRSVREREAKLGKMTRQRDKAAEKCRGGDEEQRRDRKSTRLNYRHKYATSMTYS